MEINMTESIKHYEFVQYIKKEFENIVPEDCKRLIDCDSFSSVSLPPQFTNGHRPDVYYQFKDLLLIGEAKTNNDVERKHSHEQYESYIKACTSFQGQAILILAVPLMEQATIHNILCKLKKKYPGNYQTKVLGCI
jgi:hypothetical protein